GPTKNMIKKSESCVRIRENNTEFSTCSSMGSEIRYHLQITSNSSDYNSSGRLNGLMMQILKKDDLNDRGQRGICLTKNITLLDGFDFGKMNTFNNVVKKLPEVKLDREQVTAQIYIPETDGENHLYNFSGKSWMRYKVQFAIISDMKYDPQREKAVPLNESCHGLNTSFVSEWIPAKGVIPDQKITLCLADKAGGKLSDNDSLLVAVTLNYGDVGADGMPHEVKYAAVTRIFTVG
ncbi:MAG: hypothetical protein Q8909_05380, partial [Bacteroidota bacterium]|nr:hypothetical protein [Bacteroidota bacterium]